MHAPGFPMEGREFSYRRHGFCVFFARALESAAQIRYTIYLSEDGKKEALFMSVKEKFLRYIALDTTSDDASETSPSTACQFALANLLRDELTALGVVGARVDKHCYVYGEIPANTENQPVIGLIAHVDTVDSVPASPMRARTIHYEGGDIVLNEEKNIVMREKDFETLKSQRGEDLIVTDGTTLLGADDKAGVAEIMEAAEYMFAHPEFKHGRVMIGFTPDEEVGRGADLFDVKGFGADFAYTVDGGAPNEIEYENFNAASANVVVHGLSIHPGSAKNKMVNALKLAIELNAMLPPRECPENTEGYEGFYHLCELSGQEQQAVIKYIIRDHDAQKFALKQDRMRKIVDYLNDKYGAGTFELTLREQYLNMRQIIEQNMDVVTRAENAISACGMTPKCVPIRGGTDGARLSYMGLPCPNLGTGGANCHGVFEYASVQAMERVVGILLETVRAR